MKNKRIVSVILTLAMLLSFLPNVQASAKVKFNSKARTVEVGKTVKVSISGAKKVKWNVSGTCLKITKKTNKYAMIKGIKEGGGYLCATVSGKMYSCFVNVTKPSYKNYLNNFTVNSQELCNDNGIVITLDYVKKEKYALDIGFIVKNNSGSDYSIANHEYAVNSLYAGGHLYSSDVNVPNGKKARFSTAIEYEWFVENSIKKIKTLSFVFWGYNNNFKDWQSNQITVKTSLYDGSLYVPNGKIVYSDNGIDLYFVSSKNNVYTFCMYNKNDEDIRWSIENCSVNDWSYDLGGSKYDLYNEANMGKCYKLFKLPVEKDFISENKIKKITNLEFYIEYSIGDSYTENTTEKINVEN